MYNPTSGDTLIDNLNNTKVELYSLRSQIGIVPQEPLLFQGTIYDNIALANGSSTSDEVMEAAKCACAHEFIMKMPMGYSSLVGERGSALSGGQNKGLQLLEHYFTKNKLIIFDEATSALDYDTEKRVCENIKVSLSESTVLFVTHRLQTIKNANLICMMKDGIIEEKGTHEQLMDKKGLYYALQATRILIMYKIKHLKNRGSKILGLIGHGISTSQQKILTLVKEKEGPHLKPNKVWLLGIGWTLIGTLSAG